MQRRQGRKAPEYPLFQCDCHWLRITDAGDMEIVECSDDGVERAHGFIERVTTDEPPGKHTMSFGSRYTIDTETSRPV